MLRFRIASESTTRGGKGGRLYIFLSVIVSSGGIDETEHKEGEE